MNIKEILLGYLAKQLGITEDAAAELLYQKSEDDENKEVLKDNALQLLLEKDKERVAAIKSTAVDKTKVYDEAYADAKKKVLAKAEKSLAKKYGIEGEEFKLDTLVADIIAKETEGLKSEGELTEDAVKKHPAYLALERNRNEEINRLNTEHEDEVKKIRADYAKTETLGEVKGKVLTIFDGLKPVLSKDATKAANQRTDFAERFANYDYEKQQDGSYLVLDAEGKRIEDGHGNPISLDKLVERDAGRYYDFAVQDPKGSAGNGDGSGNGDGGKVTVPTSEDEYNMAIINATTAEEREAITAAYESAK